MDALPEIRVDALDRWTTRLIVGGEEPLAFGEILRLWQTEAPFREAFGSILAGSPFPAVRWETPPITRGTIDRTFECVVIDSPALAGPVDPLTFADHFTESNQDEGVVAFDNLGGDARLVVPSPRAASSVYGHLASFLRKAPAAQRDALWLWLSTAGGGVAWLHVRLDSRPKYYHHRPYRDER